MGIEDRVRFWRDRWCGDVPLECLFPLIFQVASDWEASMASYVDGIETGSLGYSSPTAALGLGGWAIGVSLSSVVCCES